MKIKQRVELHPELDEYLEKLDIAMIPKERKLELDRLQQELQNSLKMHGQANLIFICTHNSRRSQMAQVWAQTCSYIFDLNIRAYSGGTETTRFNKNALQALKSSGFKILEPGDSNPLCLVYPGSDLPAIRCWSKHFGDASNPREEFIAVMTCNDADENCPFVPGALKRISLPYVDPKHADGTAEENLAYSKCCEQIATEMYYMFNNMSV